MTIGAGILLIAVGAILRFGISTVSTHGFGVHTIGDILMGVGVLGVVLWLLVWAPWAPRARSRRTVYREEVPPGAYTASVQWYRAGSGTASLAASETTPAPEDRLHTPAVVLWPEHDPLFPREWSDRIDEFFSRARLRLVDGVGHYAPLEYPAVIAEEVRGFLADGSA